MSAAEQRHSAHRAHLKELCPEMQGKAIVDQLLCVCTVLRSALLGVQW